MLRIEVEQLAASRTAPEASQPALDFIEADALTEPLRDLQRNETSKVVAAEIATPRI